MSNSSTEDDSNHDVMISYSHSDSKQVAELLYEELTAYGLDVWYDGVELTIGSNIRDSIDKALTSSDHAVILISPTYFEGMSQWELDGIVQRHNSSEHDVILPLLHELEFSEVREKSPSLANIIGEKVTDDNIDDIAAKLYTAIQSSDANDEPDIGDIDSGSRVDIQVSLEDLADISKGSKVTINEWRTEGTPHDRGVRAVKMTVDESGLSYTGSNFVGTSRVVKDEPLEGHVSDISQKSSKKTEFTLRIPQSRLDDLSDDPSDYTSGFVR
ncbi:toll/interleukin-1 receptor domain-containing protein [Haloferax gibbonsii]|uniref:toll/interleukin-1 receptor domain-containing protein n=1 Tax=Haloferax gibbonsii TaxID=35746 RepID=UPI0009E4B243|nr:toll/interleukin-1 receptor domain-containing protein [Haloferax gibbonsii]